MLVRRQPMPSRNGVGSSWDGPPGFPAFESSCGCQRSRHRDSRRLWLTLPFALIFRHLGRDELIIRSPGRSENALLRFIDNHALDADRREVQASFLIAPSRREPFRYERDWQRTARVLQDNWLSSSNPYKPSRWSGESTGKARSVGGSS